VTPVHAPNARPPYIATAVLRLVGSRHAKAATVAWRQIIKASSSNAITTRRVTGSSTASS
jgi:hypothetical protein